jgi:hypothetical protein
MPKRVHEHREPTHDWQQILAVRAGEEPSFYDIR